MKVSVLPDGTIHFEEIAPPLWSLIESIPTSAESDDPRALARLFPQPVDEPEAAREWSEYVVPSLQEAFLSARQLVLADLEKAHTAEDHVSLSIPSDHAEAWMHTLNQARLSLASTHGYETDLPDDLPADPGSEEDFALYKIHFYGVLMEWFVQYITDTPPEEQDNADPDPDDL